MGKKKKFEISNEEFYKIRNEVWNRNKPNIIEIKKNIRYVYANKNNEEKENIKDILNDILYSNEANNFEEWNFILLGIIIPSFFSILTIAIDIQPQNRTIYEVILFIVIVYFVVLSILGVNKINNNKSRKNDYRFAKLYLKSIEEIEFKDKFYY